MKGRIYFHKGFYGAKAIIVAFIIAAIMAGILYCANIEAAAPVIRLGWIGPLTGPSKMLADNAKGIQLAIKQYNASKSHDKPYLELILEDSPLGSNVELQKYNDLVHNKNAKVIFTVSVDDTIALAKYATRDKIIIINAVNNDHTLVNLSPNVFLIAKTTESMAAVIVDSMIANKYMKALVLHIDTGSTTFMATLAQSLTKMYTAAGGKAYVQPYNPNEVNFKPFLSEGINNQVDAYVFLGYDSMGLAIKQAREMGIKKTLYANNTITNTDFKENVKAAIHGVLFPNFTYLDGNRELAPNFLNEYNKQYHQIPQIEWAAMQGYDAGWLVIQAIDKATSYPNNLCENIRKYLINVHNYRGISGNISIRANGASEGIYPSLYIFQSNNVAKKVK